MFKRMKANHKYQRFIVTLYFCEHLCDCFDSMCLSIEERFVRCNRLYWGYRLSKFYNKKKIHYSTKKYLQKEGYALI